MGALDNVDQGVVALGTDYGAIRVDNEEAMEGRGSGLDGGVGSGGKPVVGEDMAEGIKEAMSGHLSLGCAISGHI